MMALLYVNYSNTKTGLHNLIIHFRGSVPFEVSSSEVRSLSRFGHSWYCPFRGSVLFEVRSFEVRSLSRFGHSRFGPFRGSVILGSVFRRSVFRSSVFRGSVTVSFVTTHKPKKIMCNRNNSILTLMGWVNLGLSFLMENCS